MEDQARAGEGRREQEKESAGAVKQTTHNPPSSSDHTGVDMIGKTGGGGDKSTENMRGQIASLYGRETEDVSQNPLADVEYILEKAASMTPEQALEILTDAVEFHRDDPNFPGETMRKIKCLIQDPDAGGADRGDPGFDLRAEAAIIHYHSPYPEVRSVTTPGDDPSIPVETIRAYFLGLVLMGGCTAVNTFFSPRQPSISINALVMQLLLAPCGFLLSRVLPDWGVTVGGTRHSLNPGPWSYKEQIFASIIFTIANSPGNVYYVYLVQRLPQYLGNSWVSFGYEIVLAMSTQFCGLAFAGLLRRFVIYPSTALFPKVFPALAVNRALVTREHGNEVINGWRLSRSRFFATCFLLMFLWFWIPNYLFQALRTFNWMTWIAPDNLALGLVTGSWGGMGFNPWATFDWNFSGTSYLVTPFFSAIQQYGGRVLSGLIIIGMYWGNMHWSAYMPINSNEAFANDGTEYNVTRIVRANGGGIDLDAYKAYGPPFFSGANVFGQGAWFAWYPMTLFSVGIHHWESLKKSAIEMYQGVRHRRSIYESYHDPHTRLIRMYPEVPDWWFLLILLVSLVLGICALEVWPLNVPVWSLFALIGINIVMVVPAALLMAWANVNMGFNVLFQLLAGLWFPGNLEALIIVTVFGQNFSSQADNYISDQKMAHYSRIPPRAVFRGQVLAVLCNCFIFVGMLDWMVTNFDDGTLCQWNNKQHFVCSDAVLVFASAIEYGAFGVRNMFELYPILPWCFLLGAVVGIAWGLVRRYGPSIRRHLKGRSSGGDPGVWDRYVFGPLSALSWFDPAVCWAGALQWTGGNNLAYATNGIYLSFIFMYYIKRRYGLWWGKYNYLVEAGLDMGVAISAIIQTFALSFTGVELSWWGNTISTGGVDYLAYNQNASLLPLPEKGHFGPAPEQYPMHFS